MVQFNFVVIAIGLIFSLFLCGNFISFQKFHERTNPYRNWDTAALASANRIALESSELLVALQESYKQSILAFESGDTINNQNEINKRNALVDEFSARLNEALRSTINQGLEFNNANGLSDKQKHENFAYQLIHSNYVPFALADKKYNSTLISESKISNFAENISNLNDSGQLQITENLLETLIGKEKTQIIKANQSQFSTRIDDEGLDFKKLPTGLKLNIKYDSDLDTKKSKITEHKLISTAQIKLVSSKEVLPLPTLPAEPVPQPSSPPVPAPALPNPPASGTPSTPNGGGVAPSPQIGEIEFSLLPIDKRAIIYDPTKPITKTNPIRIINTKEGGYSLLYVGDDGYINVGIGDAKTNNVSVAKSTFNSNTTFSSATLTLVDENANPALTNVEGYSIKIDTLPRGHKRYTTVDSTFVVNGMTIPKGFIVVGTKASGTGGRPGLAKFDNFRVYDPESGALITYFGQNALSDKNKYQCRDNSCFNFDKFYTEPGTKFLGADLYESFSVGQLFTNTPAAKANQLWINIQGDLERDTKLNINLANEPWQEHILKELNDDEMVYLGHELRFEDMAAKREIFGFQTVSYKDSTAKNLDDAQFNALLNYAQAKLEYWEAVKTNSPATLALKNKRDDLKKIYEQKHSEFNNYIKYGTLPDSLKPTVPTVNPGGQAASPANPASGGTAKPAGTNSGTKTNDKDKDNDKKNGSKKKK